MGAFIGAVAFTVALIVIFKVIPAIQDKKHDKKCAEEQSRRDEEAKRCEQAMENYKSYCIKNFSEVVKSKKYAVDIDKVVKAEFEKTPEVIGKAAEAMKLLTEFCEIYKAKHPEAISPAILNEIQHNFISGQNKDIGKYYDAINGKSLMRTVHHILYSIRDIAINDNFALALNNEYHTYESLVLARYYERDGRDNDYLFDRNKDREEQKKEFIEGYNKLIERVTNPNNFEGFSEYVNQYEYWDRDSISEYLITLLWSKAAAYLSENGKLDKKIFTGTTKDAGINFAKYTEKINVLAIRLEYGYDFTNYSEVPDVLKNPISVYLIKVALHKAVCEALTNGLRESDIDYMFKDEFYTKARAEELVGLLVEMTPNSDSDGFINVCDFSIEIADILSLMKYGKYNNAEELEYAKEKFRANHR